MINTDKSRIELAENDERDLKELNEAITEWEKDPVTYI